MSPVLHSMLMVTTHSCITIYPQFVRERERERVLEVSGGGDSERGSSEVVAGEVV